MRSLVFAALAVAATSTPAFADPRPDDLLVEGRRERRICTQVQLRGASRISYQRVCRTSAQWRDTLGPDWRQLLNGQDNPEDDLDKVDILGGGGRTGGGVGGFRAAGPR